MRGETGTSPAPRLPDTFTPELLRKLELLLLKGRRDQLGRRHGSHRSSKSGHGIEFSDYRNYEPGDNPRDIDWNLYGRSDRMYVKSFHDERNLTLLCVLDTSASMFVPEKKWERARDIVIALSYIALLSGEDVQICAPGLPHRHASGGPRSIHRVAANLMGLQRPGGGELSREIRRAAAIARYPAAAVVVSDLLLPEEEVRLAFGALRAKNFDITAVQLLGPLDLDPVGTLNSSRVADSETGEELDLRLDDEGAGRYHELLTAHLETIRSYCVSAGIGYAQTDPDEDLFTFLRGALGATGLIR